MTRETVTAPELKTLLRTTPEYRFLVDVATPGEFREMHIRGSRNMPIEEIETFAGVLTVASREFDVVLVSPSGRRAEMARERLARVGVTHVRVLEGGMRAWVGAGGPVRTKRRLGPVAAVTFALGVLAAAVLQLIA
jgi:rhodanese-related sulfurtransferase